MPMLPPGPVPAAETDGALVYVPAALPLAPADGAVWLTDGLAVEAGAIVDWVPGAANDAGGQDETQAADPVVFATLASLLGEAGAAEVLLTPGRDSAGSALPGFTLEGETDAAVDAADFAAAVAASGAQLGSVVLSVGSIDLFAFAQGEPVEAAGTAPLLPDVADEDDVAFVFEDDAYAYGEGAADPDAGQDGIFTQLIGDAGDPGLSLL